MAAMDTEKNAPSTSGAGAAITSENASQPAQSKDLPMKPKFTPLSARQLLGSKTEFRKVFVPPHRYTPLKEKWMELYTPIHEQMNIDVRFNLKVPELCSSFPKAWQFV